MWVVQDPPVTNSQKLQPGATGGAYDFRWTFLCALCASALESTDCQPIEDRVLNRTGAEHAEKSKSSGHFAVLQLAPARTSGVQNVYRSAHEIILKLSENLLLIPYAADGS